jgi:MFS family permease
MIIAKITKPSWYICAACALWGAVSACTAAVTGYASLAICRCILGIVEAVFFPYVLARSQQLPLRSMR